LLDVEHGGSAVKTNRRPTLRLFAATSSLLLPMLAAACGGETQTPPATASAVASRAPESAAPAPARGSAPPTQVAISEDIRRACNIPEADAYFAFDSANVTTKDRTPLDAVATCVTRGPLAGKSLRRVGHADPRGIDYNMTLGQWRADAVAAFLGARGVQRDRASTTSRGAMDATGTDDRTWAHDRRVDVMLND
jgi:outer membrane protein OmpA-like peptidoglycan-associated protein